MEAETQGLLKAGYTTVCVCVAGREEEDRREDHVRRLGRGWRKSLWEERKNQKIKRQSLWLEYK